MDEITEMMAVGFGVGSLLGVFAVIFFHIKRLVR